MHNQILGFVEDSTVVYFMEKESGDVLKTQQLGIEISAVCDSVSEHGCIWI